MPPVSRIAVNCRSVRLRECGLKAWALECVATRGASLSSATSQKPRSLRCERSIRIFSRLQARISSLPRSVRPGPVSGDDGQRNGTPCPNAFGRLHTGPSERSPAWCRTSRVSNSGSIASAPSIWRTAANAPASMQWRMSSTVRQMRNRPLASRSMRIRMDAMLDTAACAVVRSSGGGKGAPGAVSSTGAASSAGAVVAWVRIWARARRSRTGRRRSRPERPSADPAVPCLRRRERRAARPRPCA